MRPPRFVLPAIACLFLSSVPATAAEILYGGLGGHNVAGSSTNDGSLAIVDQSTGAVSVLGHPAGVSRISGLVFDLNGTLFGATQGGGGFPPPPGPTTSSNLIRMNPANGSLLGSVPIAVSGTAISIADLAVQPGTGTLFGIRGPNDQLGGQGRLYTIDPVTGAATLVGDTGDFFGSIAFAPDGTLYMSAADLDNVGNLTGIALKTLNPLNAAILTAITTADFFGSLAVRSDGVIFGGNGDFAQLFTVNPATGAEKLIGSTGTTFIGDLAFQSVPEPGGPTLLVIGLLLVLLAQLRTYARKRVMKAS